MFMVMGNYEMSKIYSNLKCFHDGSKPLIAGLPVADIVISGNDNSSVVIGVYPKNPVNHGLFYEGAVASKEDALEIGNELVGVLSQGFDELAFDRFLKGLAK